MVFEILDFMVFINGVVVVFNMVTLTRHVAPHTRESYRFSDVRYHPRSVTHFITVNISIVPDRFHRS